MKPKCSTGSASIYKCGEQPPRLRLAFSFDIDRNANRAHETPGAQLSFDASTNHVASGNGVTYDAAGNIINDGTCTYTYDAEYRITSVGTCTTATYFYDALGRRARRSVGSSNYEEVYDLGGRVVAEVYSSGWGPGEVYAGSRHLANYSNGTTYFPLTDWLGSERVRTDVNGNSAGTCTTNPYGDNYSCSASGTTRIGYAGMEHDSESGLYHTHFRYYNPRLSAGTCTSNPYGDNYSCSASGTTRIGYTGMEYDSESGLYHTHFRYSALISISRHFLLTFAAIA